VGYSDHAHLGGLAPTEDAHSAKSGGFSVFGWLILGVVVALWALFAFAALTSPGSLTDVWRWVEGLPMAAKIVAWVLGLPWLAAIAIWQGDWPDAIRFVSIAALALASVWTFWPNRYR
jgi:hypothetical protein